jgi:hypothetical protein
MNVSYWFWPFFDNKMLPNVCLAHISIFKDCPMLGLKHKTCLISKNLFLKLIKWLFFKIAFDQNPISSLSWQPRGLLVVAMKRKEKKNNDQHEDRTREDYKQLQA